MSGAKEDHESDDSEACVGIKPEPVAKPESESKPVFIDLEDFSKMCDVINSLEKEVDQRRLTSKAQSIKGNVDKYVYFFQQARQDAFNKSVRAQSRVGRSAANHEIELVLRFEDMVGRLQKLSSLLNGSESELRDRMSTMKEVSRPVPSVARILERKLCNFHHKCVAASVKKEPSIVEFE